MLLAEAIAYSRVNQRSGEVRYPAARDYIDLEAPETVYVIFWKIIGARLSLTLMSLPVTDDHNWHPLACRSLAAPFTSLERQK